MSLLRLEFTRSAREQLEEALDWWASHRDKMPSLLAKELEVALEVQRRSPAAGARYDASALPGLRRYLLRRTRFHVYYVSTEETLTVVAL